jgi:hypothetical protein
MIAPVSVSIAATTPDTPSSDPNVRLVLALLFGAAGVDRAVEIVFL